MDSRVLAGGWLPRRPRCTTCFLPSTLALCCLIRVLWVHVRLQALHEQASKSERYLVCISRLCALHDEVSSTCVGRSPFYSDPSRARSLEGSLDAICNAMACTSTTSTQPSTLHRLPSRTCMRSVGATPTAKMSPSHPARFSAEGVRHVPIKAYRCAAAQVTFEGPWELRGGRAPAIAADE
jgi:hypothetical protein